MCLCYSGRERRQEIKLNTRRFFYNFIFVHLSYFLISPELKQNRREKEPNESVTPSFQRRGLITNMYFFLLLFIPSSYVPDREPRV